jgi:hypothetical protein
MFERDQDVRQPSYTPRMGDPVVPGEARDAYGPERLENGGGELPRQLVGLVPPGVLEQPGMYAAAALAVLFFRHRETIAAFARRRGASFRAGR